MSLSGKQQKTKTQTKRGDFPRRFASFQEYRMANPKMQRTEMMAVDATIIFSASCMVALRLEGYHSDN